MNTFKKILRYLFSLFLGVVVLFYLVTSAVILTCETDLVFHPHKLDDKTPLEERPQILPAAENIEFTSDDGLKLHGYFLQSGSFIDENTIPVLYCHGNGGNCLYSSGWFFFDLQPANDSGDRGPSKFAMLSFDYRAYGFSEGKKADLSENAVYSDARAARKWLAQKCAKSEREIILMGHSLGGGVASELAKDGTPKLILCSTFDSVPDTAQSYCPILPAKLLMKNRFASAEKLAKLNVPILQFHDPVDRIVPYRNGLRLHVAANEPKEFVILNRLDHNYAPNAAMKEKIITFLTQNHPAQGETEKVK
ncbi:MAG: alpha/beta hydrolase [Thermoguttaceae bacterium]|nr:alpha/beta hydrolase [Thermoguttaceae bacterium]